MRINALSLLLSSTLSAAAFSDLNLRILPLGASITTGEGSQLSGLNGFRLDLVRRLAGNVVNILGSRREGYMANNYNDGYSGYTIDAVKQAGVQAYQQKPNVVLIHAGTNDLDSSNRTEVADAPRRLGTLIQTVIDNCPDVLVLVAQIIPRKDPEMDILTKIFNNGIPTVVKAFTDQQKHVMAVDMYKAVSVADLAPDGKHPNSNGYKKMADAWYDALDRANGMGWIKSADDQDRLGTCDTNPVWTEQQGELFQESSPDANSSPGTICKDDPENNSTCTCTYGAGKSNGTESVARSAAGCANMSIPTSPAVRFADLDGDGRAEYLWLSEDGAVTAHLNQRLPDPDPAYKNVPNPKNALIHWNPQGVVAPAVDGGRRELVHFTDLNGDGRADYLIVHPNGSVSAWLNVGSPDPYGPSAGDVGWRALGLVFDSIGLDGAGVRFADLNGDGLPEYLYVSPEGAVRAFRNHGAPSTAANKTNNNYNNNSSERIRWSDAGVVASNPGLDRNKVRFADLKGDGRWDLVEVAGPDGSVRARMNLGAPLKEKEKVKVRWGGWIRVVLGAGAGGAGDGPGGLNDGPGGLGDGVRLADLNSDGRADYLHVGADGRVRGWVNGCVVGGGLV